MKKTFEEIDREKAQNKLELIIRFSDWINENVSFVQIKYNHVVDFLEQDEEPNDKDLERAIKNIGNEIKQSKCNTKQSHYTVKN